jgi:hypothetical protein
MEISQLQEVFSVPEIQMSLISCRKRMIFFMSTRSMKGRKMAQQNLRAKMLHL